MSPLLSVSISSGLLSGILVWLANSVDIPSWIFFLGATSYFASTDKGFGGLMQVWFSNCSGAMLAIVIILVSGILSNEIGGSVTTGVIAFIMCFQAKLPILKFIPGTFLGAIAIFASQGNWLITFFALFFGAIFGYLMTEGGEYLHRKTTQKPSSKVKATI